MAILWDDSYKIGIDIIDRQHKEFVDTLNDLIDAMDKNNTNEVIASVFDRIERYATYHFQTEEMYFDEFHYEEADEHKAIHAAGCVRSSAQDEAVKKRQRAGTDALRGKPAWNRGRSHSETTLQRISVAVKAHHAYKRELKKCGKIPETHPAHKFGSGSSAGLLF